MSGDASHGGGGEKKKSNPFVMLLVIVLAGFAIYMFADQLYQGRAQITWVRDFLVETIMRFIGPVLIIALAAYIIKSIFGKKDNGGGGGAHHS